ncbi:MAG: nucleoside triphosphate pyrophosphohydrolase [Chloroflexi bacterium]|nr:nucleoside triphosphate pyrophosphohydrolase [Chloroflexota bacterium]
MAEGITILGLGPGDPKLLTSEAQETIRVAREIYLRTRRHPAVAGLPGGIQVESFDALYEEGASFEAVYQAIAERLLDLARRPDGVLYAVPGHPLVGEASVRRVLALASEQGLPVRIVEGLSFLEPVCTLLGLDPLEGLQLADATELATVHHPPLNPDRPVLVAQLYSRPLAAEVKLTLMNLYPDDHPVTLVWSAGTAQASQRRLPLYELDRQPDIEHLTTLYLPPLIPPGSLEAFQAVVAQLRAPGGCPWDREQTHRSLRPFLLEEAYEVLDALEKDDTDMLREELGDLLLQILLHVQIAVEEGEFKMVDVVRHILAKLIRRHPHVFGDVQVSGPSEVIANWEEIKRHEKAGGEEPASILAGVPGTLPALARAQAIQRRAARVGFDWPDIEGVWAKVAEELAELRAAESSGARASEVGDLLFTIVNLARWLDVDAELALRAAALKFEGRFKALEEECTAQGRRPEELSLEELDALWEGVKENGAIPKE